MEHAFRFQCLSIVKLSKYSKVLKKKVPSYSLSVIAPKGLPFSQSPKLRRKPTSKRACKNTILLEEKLLEEQTGCAC